MVEPCFRDYMHAAAALDIRYWALTGLPRNSYQNEVSVPARDLAAVLHRALRADEAAAVPSAH